MRPALRGRLPARAIHPPRAITASQFLGDNRLSPSYTCADKWRISARSEAGKSGGGQPAGPPPPPGPRRQLCVRTGHRDGDQQQPQEDRPHGHSVRPEAGALVRAAGRPAAAAVGPRQVAFGSVAADLDGPATGYRGSRSRRAGMDGCRARARRRRWPGDCRPSRGCATGTRGLAAITPSVLAATRSVPAAARNLAAPTQGVPAATRNLAAGEGITPDLVLYPDRLRRHRHTWAGHVTVLFLVLWAGGGVSTGARRLAIPSAQLYGRGMLTAPADGRPA